MSKDRVSVSAATAKALLEGVGDFATADEVTRFLRNTVGQIIRQRIGPGDVMALGYLCQLILTAQALKQRELRSAALLTAPPRREVAFIWPDRPEEHRREVIAVPESSRRRKKESDNASALDS